MTRNSKNFGPDGRLHPELAAEVTEAGVTLEYLSDLKKVLARFAERRPVPHDDARLQARLSARSTTAWLHQFIVAEVASGPFEACVVDLKDEALFLEWTHFDGWLSTPVVEIIGWSDEADYVAADVSRLAATVKVLATGFARTLGFGFTPTAKLVAFTVDVRVIFGEDSLTALSVSGLHPVEDEHKPAAASAARRASTAIQEDLW
ncbi:hypothetical protein [Streptomyces filipinensis]|uniref:hypothetical protein n=1 Tax=Streptomyces filipinensis TaxID=66887 RepID=UPI00177BA0CB|nr:hypothetical protein [Streptomyces filipinensis]